MFYPHTHAQTHSHKKKQKTKKTGRLLRVERVKHMARKLEENDIITIAVEGVSSPYPLRHHRERGVECCCAIQREVVAGL
jgi:hypothetical protein